MSKNKRRDFLKTATSVVVGGSLAGCSGTVAFDLPKSAVVGGPNDLQSELTVLMYAPDNGGEGTQYHFRPHVGFIEPGTTVRWKHAGDESALHSATAFGGVSSDPYLIPRDAKPFNTGAFAGKKDPRTHTFDTEGVYMYYCMPHKAFGMAGAIVVGDVRPDDPGWGPGMTKPVEPLDVLSDSMRDKIPRMRTLVNRPYPGGDSGQSGSGGGQQ